MYIFTVAERPASKVNYVQADLKIESRMQPPLRLGTATVRLSPLGSSYIYAVGEYLHCLSQIRMA